jgi:hypothetical protein
MAPMTEDERKLLRTMYELQVELFNHQGDEIDALQKANASLRKSHEVLGRLLQITAQLMGVH